VSLWKERGIKSTQVHVYFDHLKKKEKKTSFHMGKLNKNLLG
jgi:hypothetical protein